MCRLTARGLRHGWRQQGPEGSGRGEMEHHKDDDHTEQDIATEQDFHAGALLHFFYFFGEAAGKPAAGHPEIVFFINPRGPDFGPGDDEGQRGEADGSPGHPDKENELQTIHAMRPGRLEFKTLKPAVMV